MNNDTTPETEPTVEELLLQRIAGYTQMFDQELELLSRVTSQLQPDRAAVCQSLIAMCRIALTEVERAAYGRDLTRGPGRSPDWNDQ